MKVPGSHRIGEEREKVDTEVLISSFDVLILGLG